VAVRSDGFRDRAVTLGTVTDQFRRNLNWALLGVSVALTVLNLVDLLGGDASWSVWLGVVCWPIVAICTAYELATHRRLHL
jgi:hypothetical protein